jgi:hypothetical protein
MNPMPLPRLFALATGCVALAGATACDDPLSPQDVAGTYVLSTVRGESPPAVVWESDGMRMRLLAGSIHLNADGTGTEIWVYEFTNALLTRVESWEDRFQFEIRDRKLEGAYVCEGLCLGVVRPIRGVFTLRGLRLDISKQGPTQMEYVREND